MSTPTPSVWESPLLNWGSSPYVLLQYPDGKEMQINLTGFLNAKNARQFLCELWDLLLSAMDNIGGIPAKFLEQKKEEIKRRQVSSPFNMANGGIIGCRLTSR